MIKVKQNSKHIVISDSKTVDWIINNTTVYTFNPSSFNGYQRAVNDNHRKKIANYIKQHKDNLHMPTPIICACDTDYQEECSDIMKNKMRIVDGQHRIAAFKFLKEEDQVVYNDIKDIELPIIVLEKIELASEIDTFITINKTARKVDTSLALVLKNKINYQDGDADSEIPLMSRIEYVAIEVAKRMDDNTNGLIWSDSVLYEGIVTSRTYELITLNAFVRESRRLIKELDNKEIINLQWENDADLESVISSTQSILEGIWDDIAYKWDILYDKRRVNRKILQGTIGMSSIYRFLSKKISSDTYIDNQNYKETIRGWIYSLPYENDDWAPGGSFSKFSSSSGHIYLANLFLKDSSN